MDSTLMVSEPMADEALLAALGIYWLVMMIFAIVMILAYWKIFTKAGKPGWAAIVPIYNMYVMLEIVGRPAWWLILFFVPIANFVVLIIMMIDLAQSFGRGMGFALGLIFFPYIWMLILGFGSDTYRGPSALRGGF